MSKKRIKLDIGVMKRALISKGNLTQMSECERSEKMCGISGIYCRNGGMERKREKYKKVLEEMNHAQKHRGPDDEGIYIGDSCGLAHVRLSILDLGHGKQPLMYQTEKETFVISYNGEIYNMHELRNELIQQGMIFETTCDTEVILKGFAKWGIEVAKRLNGIFAFAIYEEKRKRMTLCRDRLGVKPLFYAVKGDEVLFASEIKAMLSYKKDLATIDRQGLCELLALGPAHTSGKTVYKGVTEVKPGTFCQIDEHGLREEVYWQLESRVHEDSKEQTIEKTSFLIQDAIRMQMLSDIPVCTFLSGGLDSSIVTSVASECMKKQGMNLATFSFEFEGNDEYFAANSFQPTQDAPYAMEMAEYLGTNHTILTCGNDNLFIHLYDAMKARDYPCMADVESSLIYFCGEVSKRYKVTLTGECADEIFGGYPWFYRQDMFERHAFPWSYDMDARTALLKEDLIQELKLEQYSIRAYEETIAQTPRLVGETGEEARRRELSYLNLRWFMATLLERMDRTSMYHGLEARVPFADHRIVEYLYNVPWKLKYMGNTEKGLLREAAKGLLPDRVLFRKKSPYPKTYNPTYERLLKEAFSEILKKDDEPVRKLIDIQKAKKYLETPMSYAKPWYGQLMAGPQMLAYYLQINMWMKEYDVKLEM